MSYDFTYTCYKCKKKVTLGKHFCDADQEVRADKQKRLHDPDFDLKEDYEGPPVKKLKISRYIYAISSMVAALLLVAVVDSELGILPAILLVVCYAVLFAVFTFVRRRISVHHEWKKMVSLCHGDKEQAERLIRYELSNRPGLSRKKAIEHCIFRLNIK